jgi:signal transduction histidine kinase
VSTQRSGDRAVLVVRDHGPGIPPGDRERIFGRFERAAGKDVSGLGLGLFIAREIVEGHRGRVRAEEAAGGGARFVVELPLQRPQG